MTRRITAALLAVLALTLGACSSGESPTEAQIDAVATQVEAYLAEQAGVSDATVTYDQTLPVATPAFSVTADTGDLSDEALVELGRSVLERIWRSDLSRVSSITVYFTSDNHERNVYLEDLMGHDGGFFTPDLEELLGPRDA